jgi:hypothetical protein
MSQMSSPDTRTNRTDLDWTFSPMSTLDWGGTKKENTASRERTTAVSAGRSPPYQALRRTAAVNSVNGMSWDGPRRRVTSTAAATATAGKAKRGNL